VARIVLVHGIAQEQKSADTLEAEWLPSLAGGIRTAGYPELADSLWRGARPGETETRMAFYGDVFTRPDQQGAADELTEADWLFAEALAEEWLARVAETAPRESDQAQARRLWAAFAERLVVKALRQVTLYLTDETVRERVQERVSALIGPETEVVIGHSLGSVVAYEAAHRLDRPLPLLITVGSPLGLRNIVYERTRPQPPGIPPQVGRWVNLADRDDLVAARPDLTALFPGADGVLASGYTVDNGSKPHEAAFYLAKPEVGTQLARILTGGGLS